MLGFCPSIQHGCAAQPTLYLPPTITPMPSPNPSTKCLHVVPRWYYSVNSFLQGCVRLMSALLCPIQYVTHVMSPRVPLLLPLPMDPVLGLRHQMPLKPLGSTATTPTKPTASYPPTKYSLLQPPTKYSLLPSYKVQFM